MARFGRNSARQRLRRATRQALSAATFDTPSDCTPWVIGGLWPAELETVTPQTAMIAEYLKNDLQRIANSANERIHSLRHAGLGDEATRAEEARIINVSRAFAVLRVESTVRQLRSGSASFALAPATHSYQPDLLPSERVAFDATQLIEFSDDAAQLSEPQTPETGAEADQHESDGERLARLLAFVARQAPGLRWGVGDRSDGTTVLLTDLAHGWVPPGVALPEGVELLAPARRGGQVRELLGDVVRSAVYQPGDPFTAARFENTSASDDARALPAVHDLGWKLSEATHWRDGLPRIVHSLAKAGAARTGAVEAEIDVLRVHADTARYQLLAQYPDVDAALLSKCLLLASTEAIATGDGLSANYHFAWFEALDAPPASRQGDDRA